MGSSFWECNSLADILFVLKLEQIINTLRLHHWGPCGGSFLLPFTTKEMVSYFADDNFQGCDHISILLAFKFLWVLIKLQQVFSHILSPLECNS